MVLRWHTSRTETLLKLSKTSTLEEEYHRKIGRQDNAKTVILDMLLDQSSLTTKDWVIYIFSFLRQKHKEPDFHNVQNAGCVASTFLPERLLEETIAVNSLSRKIFFWGKLGLVIVF